MFGQCQTWKMDNLANDKWRFVGDNHFYLAKIWGYIVFLKLAKHDIGNEQDNYCGKWRKTCWKWDDGWLNKNLNYQNLNISVGQPTL